MLVVEYHGYRVCVFLRHPQLFLLSNFQLIAEIVFIWRGAWRRSPTTSLHRYIRYIVSNHTKLHYCHLGGIDTIAIATSTVVVHLYWPERAAPMLKPPKHAVNAYFILDGFAKTYDFACR